MTDEIKRGFAFLMPSGPRDQLHLHIALTDERDGSFLAVNISSVDGKSWHDKTCLFAGGEHKSITKPSFAFYQLTTQLNARHVKNMINKKLYKEQPEASEVVCDALCDGVCKSEHTPRGMKKYYEENDN